MIIWKKTKTKTYFNKGQFKTEQIIIGVIANIIDKQMYLPASLASAYCKILLRHGFFCRFKNDCNFKHRHFLIQVAEEDATELK